MKSNITLIGMPGAGKSTIGILLAKQLGLGFIDTDILIQINQQKTLQALLDETDYLNLRMVEEQEVLKINVQNQVIATGGSVVYSSKAMEHLCAISDIVFLDVSLQTLRDRITNFDTRGIAKAPEQTFAQLFEERQILYRRYAELVIDCNGLNQDQVMAKITEKFEAG